jgi:hypothetical protein
LATTKILIWNIDGLPSSYTNLLTWLSFNNPDLAVFQETMATLPVVIPGYTTHSGGALETLGRPKRGFAEAYSNKSHQNFDLPPTIMPEPRRWRHVTFMHNSTEINLIHVYFPQADNELEVASTLNEITEFIKSRPRASAWIITGDFNARINDSKTNLSTQKVLTWAQSNGLTLIPPIFDSIRATCMGPSGGSSLIDHTFACPVAKSLCNIKLHSGFAPDVSVRHAYAILLLSWKTQEASNRFPHPCQVFSILSLPQSALPSVALSLMVPFDQCYNSIIQNEEPVTKSLLTKWWSSITHEIKPLPHLITPRINDN